MEKIVLWCYLCSEGGDVGGTAALGEVLVCEVFILDEAQDISPRRRSVRPGWHWGDENRELMQYDFLDDAMFYLMD